ncbi:MAG: class II aldolase/adducin family protein [Pseudomonadota bacterium]
MSVQALETSDASPAFWQERVDLAAAFRLAAQYNFHEAVANHFSLALDETGERLLINPFGRHFSRIKASELLVLDETNAQEAMDARRVETTAWCIHGPIHRIAPRARCVLHTHMKYATVLTCLKDSNLPPIDQNTMRFFGQVAVDEGFEGMATTETEGARLAGVLGDKSVLVMGNHGALVVGRSVAEAFDTLYYFERACETLLTAYMTGKELRVCSDAVARQTAAEWAVYLEDACDLHFAELKAMLDEQSPGYKD